MTTTSTFRSRTGRVRTEAMRTLVPLLVVMAVLLAVVAAVRGYTGNYQPLGPGSLGMPSGTRLVDTGAPDGALRYRTAWKAGGRGEFGTTLRNDGRWRVRILDVTPVRPPAAEPLLAPLPSVLSNPRVAGFEPGSGPRFRPFDLRPGTERFVLFRMRIARCVPAPLPDEGTWIDAVAVRWRALGVEHRDVVPLGYRLDVGVTGLTRCR